MSVESYRDWSLSLSSPPAGKDEVSDPEPTTSTMFEQLDNKVHVLRQQIEATETQLQDLKLQLARAERDAREARDVDAAYRGGMAPGWIDETFQILQRHEETEVNQSQDTHRWPLEPQEYTRYGRQLILPQVGLFGQLKLKNAKVLIVGLGGLGCPAAAYLAGAGVGVLGLMDGDRVEVSNLHRQIIHSNLRIGMTKVDSAYHYLQACVTPNDKDLLNPHVMYNRYRFHLSPDKAISIFETYDLVLDCTDNPTSRYLISDACVLTGKPLVTASALKTEGQLMVLNNPPRPPGDAHGGPCYRCIFPKPPPPNSVLSCGEGGILGPVVGAMGVLQALEAIKVLTGQAITSVPSPTSGPDDTPVGDPTNIRPPLAPAPAPAPAPANKPTLTIFSAYSVPQFRSVRLRGRRLAPASADGGCLVCANRSDGITREHMTSGTVDYIAFCGTAASANVLAPSSRIPARDFAKLAPDGSHVLIDTRDETQFAICALRGSVNVPWTGNAESWLRQAVANRALAEDGRQRFVICRLGNDSQLAARAIIDRVGDAFGVMDIKGGFRAWREEVDERWPDY